MYTPGRLGSCTPASKAGKLHFIFRHVTAANNKKNKNNNNASELKNENKNK